MRFSVFLNARTMSADADKQLIVDLEEHALLAGKLGFDAIFLPDHHFNGYMPVASDSYMFASYLAAKLPEMHFGFSVTSVPLHHPVRFVERINILDHLTKGKLLVGIGSGTTPEEMIGFGVNYKDAGGIAEENLAAAEALWAKKIEDAPVELTGFHKGCVLQRIAPHSYGERHARLMPVAMKPSSITRAAVNGWPAFIPAFTPPKIGGTDPFSHVKKYFTDYHGQLLAAGHCADTVADALSWTTHSYQAVHLAPTDEQAHAEMIEILQSYQKAVDREAEFNAKAESDESNKKTDQTNSALSEDWMATWCLYGSPQTVIAKLRAYQELGIGNILCGTTTGPLTTQRLAYANQTLRLLAEQVIPALK
ncbi:Flavin-dependent oxidoreductase, luciferase family (includes alkanesulfonate monooxygenase SsuD and methylene tetrahydromethanopterin reductase) [Duganella sp. CF402]|uniref:LLM class flavin-dependent oxidoreductase n=1 Tax=unclassified Duganella TaxID=2636909 RepID=UPI0008B479A1|nr:MULTISPECIES: LLM class flavin-dependent oxidoreductase [unclassified Duganella]RZT08195.1 alkanesulfonate monooxygenase SsuD/methylene tetrahydromethanopterin reductase-like flavin-dependent oxidoreductase (luciferase family) [Duganella sp. BK701]SEM02536.1 Flavin-dependent oxidoreductase, luciferase family (includes alkanesulfonate monooxygenase SsuD and methylene tetrahydromethanopterin reductase) [Duganella sp. CF402]